MTAALTVEERRKLIGILGRLGSDHDGERAAAGLLATRLLKTRGLGWDQVVGLSIAGPEPRRASAWSPPASDWRERVGECLRHPSRLTDREISFLQSLSVWSGALTPKQEAWLARISSKVKSGPTS